LVYVLLTLFFFQFAIKAVNTGGAPYVAWVLPVIIFWNFINNVISSSVGSLREYGYLIRHRTFDMRLVAIVKVMSCSYVHIPLMVILVTVLSIFFQVPLGWKTLGVFYFFVLMCAMLVAFSWFLSAVGVFWKDVRNLVSIFLQVEFWISPIFWEPSRFPLPIAIGMYLNPFYYPMQGYRQAILGYDLGPHFESITIYYLLILSICLWVSSRLFRKLSKNFGDVL